MFSSIYSFFPLYSYYSFSLSIFSAFTLCGDKWIVCCMTFDF